MSFDNLGLSADLLRAVRDEGYEEPTPIQSLAIPAILEGRDIMARAQTGTGKTAGFTLPLLHRLMEPRSRAARKNGAPVRALILAPTRELAAQVRASVATYGRYLPLRSAVVYGGVGFRPQVQALRRGVDVLVATPGRLLDHVRQGTADLSKVETLVLDEADRMLDMGFIHDIRKILEELPEARQNLLFSATLSPEIRKLADALLNAPSHIEVPSKQPAAEAVEQIAHPVDRERKGALLSYLIGSQQWRQTLVFTRTRRGADRLTRNLQRDGIRAVAIHGDKTQGARSRALEDFRRGNVPVLVATDIAARGLDIDQLPHVVNFDLPLVAEDYVHRIGRTGRAGNAGNAVSLVSPDEQKLLRGIERLLKRDVATAVVPGFEPSRSNGNGNGNARERERGNDRNRRPMRARAPGRRDARFGRDRDEASRNRRRRRPRSA